MAEISRNTEAVLNVAGNKIKRLETRIAELEALAKEIVRVHRDVDSGADIPIHIYKMARDALGETV